jgi:archaellin
MKKLMEKLFIIGIIVLVNSFIGLWAWPDWRAVKEIEQFRHELEERTITRATSGIELISGTDVIRIIGHAESESGQIDKVGFVITTYPASKPIDLSRTLITLRVKGREFLYSYNPTFYDRFPSGDIFESSAWPASPTNGWGDSFGLIVSRDPDGTCTGPSPTINPGDLITLAISPTGRFGLVGERVEVTGEVIPDIGTPAKFAFTTPSDTTQKSFDLQ